jgi:hypothetical protein
MPDSTMAQIITAYAAVITAIGGLLAVVIVLIPLLLTARSTHKIVNQQQTDLRNYQAALIRALEEKGITVPVDQSAPHLQVDR